MDGLFQCGSRTSRRNLAKASTHQCNDLNVSLTFRLCVLLSAPPLHPLQMRRPWIKIEVSTPDKPEICAIATRLRIDPDAVVGKLVRLWSWAELSGIQANDLNVTKEFIDKVCGRKGFADALIQAGWLLENDGKLAFPKFDRHNGNASKVRGLTARRVEQHRVRKGKPNASSVTKKPAKQKTLKSIEPKKLPDPEHVISVKTEDEGVLTVEEVNEEAVVHMPEDFTKEPLAEVEAPSPAPPVPESLPEPHSETPPEVIEASDDRPKKRRSKAGPSEEEQPMLF